MRSGHTTREIKIGTNGGKNINKLPIQEFDMADFVENPSIIMVAKRGSGKSWVVRAVLEHFKNVPVGVIISPTDKNSAFYGKFFPDTYIFYEYKSELIERIANRQNLIIEKSKEKLKKGKKIDTRTFIVMDDCLASKGAWAKDVPIQDILFNGRHSHIMYILTMQFPLGITPELRANFDYIFLLADDTISNLKRIYEHYAGMFPSFDSFKQIFEQLTENHSSMVIVNRGTRSSFLDKIFWYKAPDLSNKQTVFGCKQFRTFHEKNYNHSWKKKQAGGISVDEFILRRKKAKTKLAVDKIKNE